MASAGPPPCCELACGTFVPLIANGNYNDPNGGKTYIKFGMTASPWCGISVAGVLRGNLEGLEGRDDLAGLNPNSGSVRLRIEVNNPPSFGPSQ